MPEQGYAFSLAIEGVGAPLLVTEFTGREALSRPYSFELVTSTRRVLPMGPASLLGSRATLAMRRPGAEPRLVHGVIASQQVEGHRVSNDSSRLRFRLVPRLWYLRKRKNSRVFQDKDVREIVHDVLGAAEVEHRFALDRRYEKLDYCVQYRETDYEFVSRLLAEFGLYYYFEHPADLLGEMRDEVVGTSTDLIGAMLEDAGLGGGQSERMVVCDHAAFYPAVPVMPGVDALASMVGGVADAVSEVDDAAAAAAQRTVGLVPATPMSFAREQESVGADVGDVRAFALRNAVRPTHVTRRSYDFGSPHATQEVGVAVDDLQDAPLPARLREAHLEIYEHKDEYGVGRTRRRDVRAELERHQSRVVAAFGASHARGFAPGHRFALVEHPDLELNRDYVLVKVEHEAHTPETAAGGEAASVVYQNRFECAPAEVTVRPEFRERRGPTQHTLETATVVGPKSEEIYTDVLGRVKVQFHWDREGANDEHSSCWLRVAQAWAGPARGALFVPRIGDEVLVAMLEGDVDRPVILGSLYNGANPAPFPLPDENTRSGFRTCSSPGGQGYNELSFDDSADHEQIRIHAQKDLDEVIEHDRSVSVKHDQRTNVTRNASDTIGGARSVSVGGDQGVSVGGDASLAVGKNHSVDVTGNDTLAVDGDRTVNVYGALSTMAATDRSDSSLADYTLRASDLMVLNGTNGVSVLSDASIHVDGGAVVVTAPKIELRAAGGAFLTLEGDTAWIGGATVFISGSKSTATFDDAVTLGADGQVAIVGDTVTVSGSGSDLKLSNTATLEGASVALKSGGGDSTSADSESSQPTTMSVQDSGGRPAANQPFVVRHDDGSATPGRLDADGNASLNLAEGGTFELVNGTPVDAQ